MYNQFGPTARICFELPKRKSHLNKHRHRFEVAFSSLSPTVLRGLVAGTRIFDIDQSDTSLTIILLKRLPGADFSLSTVEIITPTAEIAVRDQLRRESDTQRRELYRDLACVDLSGRLAGIVYEMLAHENLRRWSTISLNLVPMIRKTPEGSCPRKRLPRWYSNHGDEESSLSIDVGRTGNHAWDPKPDPIKKYVYYAPHKSFQPTVDSFILDSDNNRFFVFQFTTATEHVINEEILTFFSQASLPPRSNWYFVFVIPSDLSGFSCSQGQDAMKAFLEEIHLCTMTVDP